MGATFSRLKNWGPEVLSNVDLNAEIDNILNNLNPSGIDDYSTNTTQMRLQTDPGQSGSESLATSLAGEFERLRFVIKRLIGSTVNYWYEIPPTSLADIVASFGNGLPANRIVSCAKSLRSNQPLALIPNGAAASLVLDGTPTPFIYYIGGVQYTINSDVTVTGLGLAPAANNTATANLPNQLTAMSTQPTKFIGMYGTTLWVDAMGSELTARIGQICAFKVGATEYFIGYIKSSTEITNCVRGCFWNSTSTAVPAVAIADNATITLLRLTWIFANTVGGLTVTYNNPSVSATAPATPATGDYWFDLSTNTWKTYNSTAWVTANATLIGMSAQDTANCIAARTFNTYTAASNLNNVKLDLLSVTQVQARSRATAVNVYGTTIRFGNSSPIWDITTMLDTGLTEAASTYYYCYLKESGATVMSDQAPSDRKELEGLYHPTETWRCVGYVYNDGSSNLIANPQSFCGGPSESAVMGSFTPYGTNLTAVLGEPEVWWGYPSIVKIAKVGASEWGPVSGARGNLLTLALEPGLWMVQAKLQTINNGAVTATGVELGISCASTANSFPDRQVGINSDSMTVPTTSGDVHTLAVLCPIRIEDSSAVVPNQGLTVYVKYSAVTVGANLEVSWGSIIAWRIDNPNGTPL